MKFRREATYGETLRPAMKITDQKEADAYFEDLVQHYMSWDMSREVAEKNVRSNLGYYAGYYESETRRRVETLFHCAHPVFGAIAETPEPSFAEAFEMGFERGKKLSGRAFSQFDGDVEGRPPNS